jgi:hypothetical protein
MATVLWSKQYAGTELKQVGKGAAQIRSVLESAKDSNRNGRIDGFELGVALEGKSDALRDAAYGALASANASVNGGVQSDELMLYFKRDVAAVNAADTDKSTRLEESELRTLQGRGPARLVEYAALMPKPVPVSLTDKQLKDWIDDIDREPEYAMEMSEVGEGARLAIEAELSQMEKQPEYANGIDSEVQPLVYGEDKQLVGYLLSGFGWNEDQTENTEFVVGFNLAGRKIYEDWNTTAS